MKKMKREIRDRLEIRATCVSNDFLDRFMAEANGDYVKVYLYLLRHGGEGFSVKEAADALNLTDNDIKRAVNYWEKQGIYSDGSSLRVEKEIRTEEDIACSEEVLRRSEESERRSREETLSGTVDHVKDDEEFAGILFVAKHVLPALPSPKQVETLEFMYRELSMKAELIEFLLEYCAGLGKTSARYMETVAINWHEQGIQTMRQAQQLVKEFSERKRGRKTGKAGKPNPFLNFPQSEVDYDSLAKKKLMGRF